MVCWASDAVSITATVSVLAGPFFVNELFWGKPYDGAANADLRFQRYLNTYLEPAPVQEPVDASTDPQLSTLITTLLEEAMKSPEGALFDIGCGKGTLLERLAGSSEFVNSNWAYVAVDFDEMLAEVQAVARQKRLNRRVELLSVDDFYKQWPDLPRPHIYFCRNVLHELTISQTADLFRRLSDKRKDGELVFIQDLMNFQEGARMQCGAERNRERAAADETFPGLGRTHERREFVLPPKLAADVLEDIACLDDEQEEKQQRPVIVEVVREVQQ